MSSKECIAMLLAGGQGSRLLALTRNIAKPAVSFGGKYRIIDFALSNCANSGIDTVGVLTQYRPYLLHSYIGTGAAWNLDARDGGVSILPPYSTETGGNWYAGTADAIFQNIGYIESYNPKYVVILSGDHLYRMDYSKMVESHVKNNADLTISVMPVEWAEASRFGIIPKNDDDSVQKFTEKPKQPDSNLASMGIYVFSTDVLLKSLKEDALDPTSEHDFGKNIIPKLLEEQKRIFCYEFRGFWRDVGTIASYHETSMGLLGPTPELDLFDKDFPFMTNAPVRPPHYVGPEAHIDDCIIANGCKIWGTARHSIISTDAQIGPRAIVEDSVLFPGAVVKEGAHVVRAILGENSVVEAGVELGSVDVTKDTAVIGDEVVVGKGEE